MGAPNKKGEYGGAHIILKVICYTHSEGQRSLFLVKIIQKVKCQVPQSTQVLGHEVKSNIKAILPLIVKAIP